MPGGKNVEGFFDKNDLLCDVYEFIKQNPQVPLDIKNVKFTLHSFPNRLLGADLLQTPLKDLGK